MSDAPTFDPHEIRHGLKLVQKTGTTELYENRADVACPACGDPFDEVLVSTGRTNSFDPGKPLAFCILREPEQVSVFTHG